LAALEPLPAEHKAVACRERPPRRQITSPRSKTASARLKIYPKARFVDGAPVPLAGKGAVFQRLDDAADLYVEHMAVVRRASRAWRHLLRVAAMRDVLVHNVGIVDARFSNESRIGLRSPANVCTSARTTPAASC
jgi:hypothetical protein